MFLALLTLLVAAPFFWLLVPENAREDALAAASIVALGIYDVRLPVLVLSATVLLHGATRIIEASGRKTRRGVMLLGFAALLSLFCYNKLANRGESLGVIATQGRLAFLGMSYFVLKAAAILIEATRGGLHRPGFLPLLRWIVFLPIFPSGPIEEFKHFDVQKPAINWDRVSGGLERILFGCVRALVFAPHLSDWANPILASPEAHSPLTLLLAAYAFTLRFYFDFAGYSDIAIGLAGIYGYDIQENFDNPLLRRNMAGLWQHWHMTLTTWMRLYLFIPLSRAIMRRGGTRSHSWAIAAGQVWSMLFCGLWHGLGWEFAIWGLCHAMALIWINLGARPGGRMLPQGFLRWWRRSPVAYAASCFLTFNTFSLINVVAVGKLATTFRFFSHLVGVQ